MHYKSMGVQVSHLTVPPCRLSIYANYVCFPISSWHDLPARRRGRWRGEGCKGEIRSHRAVRTTGWSPSQLSRGSVHVCCIQRTHACPLERSCTCRLVPRPPAEIPRGSPPPL